MNGSLPKREREAQSGVLGETSDSRHEIRYHILEVNIDWPLLPKGEGGGRGSSPALANRATVLRRGQYLCRKSNASSKRGWNWQACWCSKHSFFSASVRYGTLARSPENAGIMGSCRLWMPPPLSPLETFILGTGNRCVRLVGSGVRTSNSACRWELVRLPQEVDPRTDDYIVRFRYPSDSISEPTRSQVAEKKSGGHYSDRL